VITIYKYPFPIHDSFTLEVPDNFKILKVEVQHYTPCIWMMVAVDRPKITIKFRLYGTGHKVESDWDDHVATFQQGNFVWHLFRDMK
jgi:hypothetical protein